MNVTGHPPSILQAGALSVDREQRQVRNGDWPLPLRAKEFDLLVMFMKHPGVALSRTRILADVWGFDVPGRTRTVDVHVNHLRQRLHGSGASIETLRGVGYRFVPG